MECGNECRVLIRTFIRHGSEKNHFGSPNFTSENGMVPSSMRGFSDAITIEMQGDIISGISYSLTWNSFVCIFSFLLFSPFRGTTNEP